MTLDGSDKGGGVSVSVGGISGSGKGAKGFSKNYNNEADV